MERKVKNALCPFYASLGDQLQIIKDDQDRLKLFETIFNYGIYGEDPGEIPDIVRLVFLGVKPNIDSYYARANGGKKGGRPRKKESDPEDDQEDDHPENNISKTKKPKDKPKGKTYLSNDKDKDKDKDKEKDTEKDTDLFSVNTYSLSLKKKPGTEQPAGDYIPAVPSGFTLGDCLSCRDANGIKLNDDQIRAFYDWMVSREWKINGQPVKILKNAMSGYAKRQSGNNDSLISELMDEKKMDKTAVWYPVYEGYKKLVSPVKYRRILEKYITDFSKDPKNSEFSEMYWGDGDFPEYQDSEQCNDQIRKWITENKKNKDDFMDWVFHDTGYTVLDEIENNINRDKREDMSKYDMWDYVENKVKKVLTAEEIEKNGISDVIEIWIHKKYPDKPKKQPSRVFTD